MTKYQPSKEYLDNINFYKEMHNSGFYKSDGRKKSKEKAYDGVSTTNFSLIIKKIIEQNKLKNMLDYGCGKAHYYSNDFILDGKKQPGFKKLWDIEIDLYDPCYHEFSNLSKDSVYDLTISIDVLEHIPTQDIEWVLEEIFSKTKKYLFMNIACYKSRALLPNGENSHINIQSPEWWHKKISHKVKINDKLKVICLLSLKNNNGKKSFYPLQYNDSIKKYL